MQTNAATWDRAVRAVAGVAMLSALLLVPGATLAARLALGAGGVYVFATGRAGTCLGYRLLGVSTCPIKPMSAHR